MNRSGRTLNHKVSASVWGEVFDTARLFFAILLCYTKYFIIARHCANCIKTYSSQTVQKYKEVIDVD